MHRPVHELAHLFDVLDGGNGFPLGLQSSTAESAEFLVQIPQLNLDHPEPFPDSVGKGPSHRLRWMERMRGQSVVLTAKS